MLIEFFAKHNKLLVVMVIRALFGIWSIMLMISVYTRHDDE